MVAYFSKDGGALLFGEFIFRVLVICGLFYLFFALGWTDKCLCFFRFIIVGIVDVFSREFFMIFR